MVLAIYYFFAALLDVAVVVAYGYPTVCLSHVPGVFFIHFSSANTSLLFAPKFNAGQIADETLT